MENWGIEWDADPKHRRAILDYFRFQEDQSDGLSCNGNKDGKEEADYELEEVDKRAATVFRNLMAIVSFLSQDCLEPQYPAKELSREMSSPKVGSWKGAKKVDRFIVALARGLET